MRLLPYKYDAFISYAMQDKKGIAAPLAARLEQAGLKIWYAGNELRAGNSIEKTIRQGLRQSRYGIVILSPDYVTKNWTLQEFYTLISRNSNRKVILPVLYNITPKDLAHIDLKMADTYAIKVDEGIDFVVDKLLREIRPTRSPIKWFVLSLFIVLALSITIYWKSQSPAKEILTAEIIEQSINKHINDLQLKIESKNSQGLITSSGRAVIQEINNRYTLFRNAKSYYRNKYTFTNHYNTFQSRKRVSDILKVDVENLNPANSYSFSNPLIYLLKDTLKGADREVQYSFINTQPVSFTFQPLPGGDSIQNENIIQAVYTNNIRSIHVSLTFPSSRQDIKYHEMTLTGMLPVETFLFKKTTSGWTYRLINPEIN